MDTQLHCFGCGELLLVGTWKRLLHTSKFKDDWKELTHSLLQECNLQWRGEEAVDKCYVCKKCQVAFEGYATRREKLRDGLRKAMQYMPLTTDINGPLSLGKRTRISQHSPSKRPRITSESPDIQIKIQYPSGIHRYNLTPKRKPLGKAIARRSKSAIITQCLKEPEMRNILVKKVGRLVQSEVATMCSDRFQSTLLKHSKKDLLQFSWGVIIEEMKKQTPVLLQILLHATQTRRDRPNRELVISMCMAMLCKLRRGSMSAFQKILSLILYAGHSSKKVFIRMHKLGISMSYVAVTRLIDDLGVGHDEKVLAWKNILQSSLTLQESSPPQCGHTVDVSSTSDSASVTSPVSSDQSSTLLEGGLDISFDSSFDVSSPLEATEPSDFMELREGSSSVRPPHSCLVAQPTPASSCLTELLDITPVEDRPLLSSSTAQVTPAISISSSELPLPIRPPVPSSVETSLSELPADLTSRCTFPTASSALVTSSLSPIAPLYSPLASPISLELALSWCGFKIVGDNVDKFVRRRFMRSNMQNLSFHFFQSYAMKDRVNFSHLSDIPQTHRPSLEEVLEKVLPTEQDDHRIHEEFAILVARMLCTYVKFFTDTYSDVIDWHITHKFTPEMSKKSEIVPLGVLPYCETERSGMIKIMTSLQQYVPHLQEEEGGLEAVHQILFGGDQLTAARARGCQEVRMNSDNSLGKLTGLKPVAEDWHTMVILLTVLWDRLYSTFSHSDFGTLLQLRNLINRRNVSSNPGKDVNATDDFLTLVVTSYFLGAAMQKLGMETLDDTPNLADFNSNSWMDADSDRRSAIYSLCQDLVEEYVDFSLHACKSFGSRDGVLCYSKELMSLGIFYLTYKDTIREGDGERLVLYSKYLLPIFRAGNRRNYTGEIFQFLYSYYFILSPRQAHQLIWNRFVNVHGMIGHNIACDLHIEHLNRVCKEAVKGVGANKTEEIIQKVGRVVGVLAGVTENFDEQVQLANQSQGHHKVPDSGKDQELILNELLNRAQVFNELEGREHTNFKYLTKKQSIFMKVNMKELKSWINEHISKN